jgi:uncharacterized membrane protein YgaE (UPF0421/DUF939 family)
MQTRLLSCLAGACFGVVVTSSVNASLHLNFSAALIGCTLAGVALGYGVSILFDVFAAPPEELD